MAVPAHDERDFEFATKYGIEITSIIDTDEPLPYLGDGLHINSGFINGLNQEEATEKMNAWLEEKGIGEPKVTYRLRDWLFSRQRYWGEPIPVVHMEDGTMRTLTLDELPLELPEVANYKPANDGQSPLANASEWLEVTFADGTKGKRETNTMPQWAGSCWYYMRYLDPHNDEAIAAPELLKHWLPVDLYVGGAEHAVLHLLYARFWHKVLYDIGVVDTKEPFKKLYHQGMILGDNNEKMSKSRGNVVNPDEIVESHGADALRLYEMFMGPFDGAIPWSERGLDGIKRWVDRVYRLFSEVAEITDSNDGTLDYAYHATVEKVTRDLDNFGFNTAISQLMIFVNEAYKSGKIFKDYAIGFIKMFSVYAPHLGEELYTMVTNETGIAYTSWPTFDPSKLVLDEIEIVAQINGKVRAKFMAPSNLEEEALKELVYSQENVQKYTEGKTILKVIVIKNKIVNIVVK